MVSLPKWSMRGLSFRRKKYSGEVFHSLGLGYRNEVAVKYPHFFYAQVRLPASRPNGKNHNKKQYICIRNQKPKEHGKNN